MSSVAAAFQDLTGRRPAGLWRAPGRVNLIGEHTDYNLGLALPFAIDRYTYVAAGPRSDGRVTCHSLQRPDNPASFDVAELRHGKFAGWPGYPLGVAWAMNSVAFAPGGFDLVFDSTVPPGGGLSSSAALEVATALALRDLFNAAFDDRALALACQRAENQVVGAPTGAMDQLASIFGRAGQALLIDFASAAIQCVQLPLTAWNAAILVVDTGVRHTTAGAGYAERRARCERAARLLGVEHLAQIELPALDSALAQLGDDPAAAAAARHVVTENHRVRKAVIALSGSDPAQVGKLLDASHQSLRDDFEVSCAELDAVAAAARATGAWGARLTGAGFGGSLLALVPRPLVEPVRNACLTALAGAGGRPGAATVVTSVAGACRVR